MQKRTTINIRGGELTLIARTIDYRDNRGYTAAPRLYVSVADETILDNLANRGRRPYNVYKSLIRSSGLGEILSLERLSWSQHAGCSCPCSPGFILNSQLVEIEGSRTFYWDAWLKLDGAPAVDETKPARALALL
jgi:hypothetical protein